jgi:MFS superfamily sulfate permease-like transporter
VDLPVNPPAAPRPPALRFDRMEWAGAFGDLGTLIPFLVAYVSLVKVDPFGILFAFGVSMIVMGAYYRTPFPVQPMKAVGAAAATQAAQTLTVTAQTVYAASLVTGLIWLILGLTGAAQRVARLVSRPVTVGIVLGLGIGFMLEGIRMLNEGWWLGGIALFGTLLLLENRIVPAMFLVLVFGAVVAVAQQPELAAGLTELRPQWHAPAWELGAMTWQDFAAGAALLALPQVPLTLGNAVIAVTEENNRLFPERPVNERRVAISTGAMNLLGAAVGGVPMCHGAGGMAGHVRFGARSGGAPVIMGSLLVVLALFFSGSVETLLQLFPPPVLGAILFLTGVQLALGSCDFSRDKGERFVTLATAALSIWNVGAGFLFGICAYHLCKRGLIRI